MQEVLEWSGGERNCIPGVQPELWPAKVKCKKCDVDATSKTRDPLLHGVCVLHRCRGSKTISLEEIGWRTGHSPCHIVANRRGYRLEACKDVQQEFATNATTTSVDAVQLFPRSAPTYEPWLVKRKPSSRKEVSSFFFSHSCFLRQFSAQACVMHASRSTTRPACVATRSFPTTNCCLAVVNGTWNLLQFCR